MFEKIVQRILSPILNQYVEDFNAQNMKIGLWSGEVVIKNVKLKKQIIKKLNSPFKIKHSRLGLLKMNIPWKSLGSSKIDILVDGLQLLITEIPQSQWQCKNTKIIEKRKQELAAYCQSIIQDFVKKSANAAKDADQQKGFFGGMLVKIIDNIQVTVKDIHIRYEDQITNKYSFGVTLEQLTIFTINKDGQPQFVDRTKKQYENEPLRKKLILSNFGVYWNEKSEFANEIDPHPFMEQSIAKIKDNQNPNVPKMNYLILMSSNALLNYRDPGKQYVQPQINLLIQFEELKIKISNLQLQQMINIGQRLQSYFNEVKVQNRKKLSQQQMLAYHKQFLKIFPAYYEKKASAQQLSRIQTILQKMQIQNFKGGIKQYLQTKQKAKMVQQKKDKNKGWFWSGPKDLTQQQMKQIQKFVQSNFGVEVSTIKRPQDYYYIKVNFVLKVLNLSIANTKSITKNEQGINLRLQQILLDFNLREGGYILNFGMNNIIADLYSKSLENTDKTQVFHILQKMPRLNGQNIGIILQQYATLKVIGNPLDKKHIDTQIFLSTQQLLIEFDPRIIKVAQDFADLKISSQNSQAALQAYGQIKNKVAQAATSAAETISKKQKKKSFISLDVNLNAINLILFFDPNKLNKDIWVVNLGVTKIFSDSQTLKKPQFGEDQPMQKYLMNTTKMSFTHYANKDAFFYSKTKGIKVDPKQIVLNDLGIDFQIQLYQKNTQKRPKISAKTVMHIVDLNLNEFTYQSIQKIGNCFAVPPVAKTQSKIQQVEKVKGNQKSQIMKQSKKIGIVYQQTQNTPKKYIAVLSGSYIYMFNDKKDVQYSTYFYVKNSKLTQDKQSNLQKKPFSLTVQNVVNKFVLGFDKESTADQWAKSINSLKQQSEYLILEKFLQPTLQQQALMKKPSLNPNLLNFSVYAAIQQININTVLYANRQIKISINSLVANAYIHQTKNVAKISLKQIKLTDNIYKYKMPQLENFLYSQSIQNKQRLIDIDFQQLAQNHPDYKMVDASVSMQVGKLVFNYKPETVQNVMRFFLPKPQSPSNLSTQNLESPSKISTKKSVQGSSIVDQHGLQQQQKKRKLQKVASLKSQKQKYVIKVDLKVQQIAIALINRKTRVMFTKVGLTNFKLKFGMSNKKMEIVGGIQQIWLRDYSKYPNTIIEQQANYTDFYNIVQTFNKQRDMIIFDVTILQIPNQYNKTMLIKSQLYDLKVSFIQQPVLRMIRYLLEQLLPSLTPTNTVDSNTPSTSQQTKPKPAVKNDVKPEQSIMVIDIKLQNVLAIVEPRDGQKQYLQLLIKNIDVKNQNAYQPYITGTQDKVLVQVYKINVSGISIIQKFKKKQVKLTNDLNIGLVCQLIQNSPYYLKTYGDKYEPGMRIKCKMTPFLMRINHQDYNFLMKCLFWNVSYDDNAEGYIFDQPNQQKTLAKKQQKGQKQQQQQPDTPAEPMYFTIDIDRIILCITQNQLPLSVLFLANLNLKLRMNQQGMSMIFQMKNLYGSHVYLSTQNKDISIQKGMWNLFGFERKLQTKNLYQIEQLVKIYSVESINQSISNLKANKSSIMAKEQEEKPCVMLLLQMGKLGDIFINMKIQSLKIAVQLRNLLVLAKLAIMQPNIQPPKPILTSIDKKKQKLQAQKAKQQSAGKMVIQIQLNNFLGSVGDKTGSNYFVMQGNILVKLKMQPSRTQQQIFKITNMISEKTGKIIDAAAHVIEIKNFTLYFCNLNDIKNKRYLLMPLSAYIVYTQQYVFNQNQQNEQKQPNICLQTVIDGQLDKVTVQCSIRDMLNINKIAQDNLSVLNAYTKQMQKEAETKQKPKEQQQIMPKEHRKSQISSLKKHSIQKDEKGLQKAIKQSQKKIKDVMKADLRIQPIQVRVINDCDNNFMPVLNFIMEESIVLFMSDGINYRLSDSLIIKFSFFNPKSGTWQPIIQTFKISFDMISQMNKFGTLTSRINISNSQLQQLKQLKINISTQLIKTLLQVLDIAKSEQKKIEKDQRLDQKQVSPFIFLNQTNQLIQIQRKLNYENNLFQMKPLFRGPIRLTDKTDTIVFFYAGNRYQVGIQRFGVINIAGLNNIHLQIEIENHNKVIKFVNQIIIKNGTFSPLYCIRYNQNNQKIEQTNLLQPNDTIPVQRSWSVQFSFNMNSFTPPTNVGQLSKRNMLISQTKKFKLSVMEKSVALNHSIFMIRTPFVILNGLPKDIQIQFIVNGKQVSSKKIEAQGHNQVFANQQMQNLKFKIICQGFYWSQQFWSDYNSLNKESYLYLSDRQKGGTTIKYMFQFDEFRNQVRLNIYCTAFIVSQLQYDLQLYSNSAQDERNHTIQKYYKLGGQSQFWTKQNSQQGERKIDKKTLIGAQSGSKIRICGKNCLPDFCQPITINNLGISNTRVAIQTQVNGRNVCLFTKVGVQVQLRKMAKKSDITCKQITIRSRWIFYNKSNRDLMVKQYGGQRFYYYLQKGEKKPFFYVLPEIEERPKQFIFIAEGTGQSIPMQVDSLGAVYFRLPILAQPNNYIFFRLNTQQIDSYLFYDITEVKYQDLPYQIVVKSPKLEAYVPIFQRQIRKDSIPINFINQIPQQPYHLQMYVRLIGSESHQQIDVEADNLNFRKLLQFYQPGITDVFILAEAYAIFNDNKKFIVIDEVKQDQNKIQEYQTQIINFRLEKISFSIIQNHSQILESYEAFYFYLQNLQFIMQQTNKRTRYQAKLQFLQLDQQQPFNIPNPVVITPIKYKQFTSVDPKDKPKSIFNALVQIDNSFVKNMFINELTIDINDLVVKVATQLIKVALQMQKQYTDAFKTEQEYKIKVYTETWKTIEPSSQGSKIFLKSIRIAPFTVQVSAQIRINQLDQGSIVFFGTILNALGVVMTNIEDAPIVFNGIVIDDCIDTLQGINNKLIQHYTSSVKGQLFKIFGSLNIIGNPVSLFRNISTGIKDMKQKPSQGLIQGPLQFGKGLAQGTSSLIAHSVGGALNSVQKATGTLATGLAALTFDKKFEEMRQRQKMKKPKHVVEGLGRGGKAMFMGFKQGVTGLFTSPVQNAKKQGFLGFLKGTAKGVTGLVVKPVTGVIDFASKTTQGLKNTALYLQDKPNENRIRNPRVLYTQKNIVKQYDVVDSKLLAIINKMNYQKNYKLDDLYFHSSFKVGDRTFLVILSKTALLVDFYDQKVLWASDLYSFRFTKQNEKCFVVMGTPKSKSFYDKSINQTLNFDNKQQADKFERLIFDMQNVNFQSRK